MKRKNKVKILYTQKFASMHFFFCREPDQRTEISSSQYRNFHLFQGREFEPEIGLYYFRNRFLDPEIGIWTTKDQEEYSDSYNLYQPFGLYYVNNVDPHGKHIILAFYGLGAETGQNILEKRSLGMQIITKIELTP